MHLEPTFSFDGVKDVWPTLSTVGKNLKKVQTDMRTLSESADPPAKQFQRWFSDPQPHYLLSATVAELLRQKTNEVPEQL